MYKMQLCNAYTKEVLREVNYQNKEINNKLIETSEKNVELELDSFILDSKQRLFKAKLCLTFSY